MSNLQTAMFIIMGEVCLMLFALLGYIVYRYIRKHRSLMSALQHLNTTINNSNDYRISQLEEFLISTCHFSDEAAETAAKTLTEKQQSFYNSLIEIYTSRDQNALMNLDSKTEEVISAYRDLVSESTKIIEQDAQTDFNGKTARLTKTIDDLSKKNQDLTGKIDRLKEEMEITVNEYSSAFQHKPEIKIEKPAVDDNNNTPVVETTDEPANTSDTDEPTPINDQDIQDTDNSADDINITLMDNDVEPAADAGTATDTDIDIEALNTESAIDATETAQTDPGHDEVDDSIEPDFETHSINDAVADTTTINKNLDDEIKADLEALTEQFDAENADNEEDADPAEAISLDGLDDEDLHEEPQQKTAQR